MTLFRTKPWLIKGRRMERNAPKGYRCDSTCTHPSPSQGTKTCLCTVCHETYSTPRNFDRHRVDGWCQEPTSVGLRRGEHGHWIEEADHDKLNRFISRFGGDDA